MELWNPQREFEKIDNLRTAMGVSQQQLCAKAGVNPTTYTHAKTGTTRALRRTTINKLKRSLAAFQQEAAE